MRRSLALACPLVLLLACGGSESSPGSVGDSGGGDGDSSGDGDRGGDGDSGNGSGDGDSGNGSGDGGGVVGCGDRRVAAGRVIPDILVVLDRSTSMKMNGVNRWDPSVMGLNAIVGEMHQQVRFGLMMYPAVGAGDGFNTSSGCTPGELDVPLTINNATPIANKLAGTQPGGFTPTAKTLEHAHQELMMRFTDGQPAPRYVMLVTDGAPNCTSGRRPSGNGYEEAGVEASVSAIEALAKDGIPTYVLGYDTASDAQLSGALDRMARAGATGDQAHRAIGDSESLKQEFGQITNTALTCEYLLAEEAWKASEIKIVFDGKVIPQDDPNGWSLSADGSRVTLRGAACDALKANSQKGLDFSINCDEKEPDIKLE